MAALVGDASFVAGMDEEDVDMDDGIVCAPSVTGMVVLFEVMDTIPDNITL